MVLMKVLLSPHDDHECLFTAYSVMREKDGTDALYSTVIEIYEDAREEYWLSIRKKPELGNVSSFKCVGRYSK